jgi:hypothetical protein
VYLDFGFLAMRPRIHEIAYSLAFMLLALGASRDPAQFAWQTVSRCLEAYESSAASRLNVVERAALTAYTAAVPMYFTALAGFSNEPVRQLQASLTFLCLGEWLLAHPKAIFGD